MTTDTIMEKARVQFLLGACVWFPLFFLYKYAIYVFESARMVGVHVFGENLSGGGISTDFRCTRVWIRAFPSAYAFGIFLLVADRNNNPRVLSQISQVVFWMRQKTPNNSNLKIMFVSTIASL